MMRTVPPTDTIEDELRYGLAVWPHLSDPGPPDDLVLASAGDLPAAQLAPRRPGRPISTDQLLTHSGMDTGSLLACAYALLGVPIVTY